MPRSAVPCALALGLAIGWLLAAAPAAACRDVEAPIGFESDTALLLGSSLGEHVPVPPGPVLYYDRSSFYPEENEVPVRGYLVRVEAFHYAHSQGLAGVFAGSDSKAILVPWGRRGDCKTARWDESAGRWISSPEPAVFAAKLRSIAAPDGTPIFDVYSAHAEPYPTAKLVRDRVSRAILGGQRFLSALEYFIFAAALPALDPESGALGGVERIRRWAAENPELAKQWPAVESLEALRARGAL